MRNKLLISTAVLAAAVMTSACEKTPNGETNQSGSATSEADQQAKRQRAEPQQSSGQPSQVPSGGTGQAEPSQQNRTTAENNNGATKQSPTQPNQPPQDQAQLGEQQDRSEQDQQARGNTNLSPEHGRAASGPVNLSRDEIRRLQMALNQKGFMVGKPDGVLGPRTRNALIAFQRQQGLEATGKIDQPSIAALSLSNGVGSTTTGRSGAGRP